MFLIFFASLTTFGSDENIPSTSVYISQIFDLRATAMATALVSDPPLPRVVILPSELIPENQQPPKH